MTMAKIDIHLTLSQAELDLLTAALTQVQQEHLILAERAKYEANFYRRCKIEAEKAGNVLDKLEGYLADALVEPHQKCPACGERQVDKLEVRDYFGQTQIHCTTCDNTYDPPVW